MARRASRVSREGVHFQMGEWERARLVLMDHLTGAWSESPGLGVGSKHGQRGSINEYKRSSLAENQREGL